MDFQEAFKIVDTTVYEKSGKHLTDLENIVLMGAWHGKKYYQIAEEAGYSVNHIQRDIGSKLFKKLSQALGEKVSKTDFRQALERCEQKINQSQNLNIEFPTRSLSSDSSFYINRSPLEELCYQEISRSSGCLIRIKAPARMGKTSLLRRIITKAKQQNYQTVRISLRTINRKSFTDLDLFLESLCLKITSNLGLEDKWEQYKNRSSMTSCKIYFQSYLLPKIDNALVLAFNQIERLFEYPEMIDFFALIRSCYNQRAEKPAFNRLVFALFGVTTPSDLIQDKNRTPFNIGKAIELNGFQFDEVKSLTQGLEGYVENSPATIKEILQWTGGQPFLTQKLCQLLIQQQADENLSSSTNDQSLVTQLVINSIVNNWETQNQPQHLRTIRERILSKHDSSSNLLSIYQQIWQRRQIPADNSPEQLELRLSGLVRKVTNLDRNGSVIKVYNPIYQQIFNLVWVQKELSKLCPYAPFLEAWQKSNSQDKSQLLRGDAFKEAIDWAEGKNLSEIDRTFLQESEKQLKREKKKNTDRLKKSFFAGTIITVFAILGGYQLWKQFRSCAIGEMKLNNNCTLVYSSGENSLLANNSNPDLNKGMNAFKKEDYIQAMKSFEQSIDNADDSNSPENQIYLNNAKARLFGSPFRLVVVIPVNNNSSNGQEMLQGVADAQTNFNQKGGLKGKLLEVIIFNDENNSNLSKKIAERIVEDTSILGVVGHNASNATSAAIDKYEEAELPLILPTSTSTEINSRIAFRIIASTLESGKKLANHATQQGLVKER